MKNRTFVSALALALITAQGSAFASSEEVKKAIEGCKGSRGTSIGQMPWGATDQDLRSYKGKNLCTNNKGRPIGENCEKTLEKLYNVASELNQMVKTGCEKFVPMFVGNKELQNCMMGGQATCSETNRRQLEPVQQSLAAFRVKLREFSQVMREQQKYVNASTDNVVKVLDESERSRYSPTYNSGGYAAKQMGVSTISEADRLNNYQDTRFAQALVEGIKKKFEESEKRYADVTEKTYDQKYQPIKEAFGEVSKLQSRVLREQLHGFLKAEELKLATKLYDNQLAVTEKVTNELMSTNQNSATNLNSLAAAGSAFPQLAALAGGGGAAGGAAGSLLPGSSPASGIQGGAANGTFGTDVNAASPRVEKIPSGTRIADASGSAGEFAEGTSISSASRSPASAAETLRESLRKKLEAHTGGSASAGSASVAGEGAMAAGEEGGDSAAQANSAGIRDMNGDTAFDQAGGRTDPLLEGFAINSLDQGGFYLSGSATEDSVKELLGEFDSELNGTAQLSKEIGGAESPSLFVRVRDFHGRCLKRGCVTGTAKGNL